MAYLLFVLVASSVGIAIVVFRHRPPRRSVDDSLREFDRNLRALAPSDDAPRGARPPRQR